MQPLTSSWCAVLCGHLLEAVAGCGARSAEDITRFLKCTYAGAANMRRWVSWLGQCPKLSLHANRTHTTPVQNAHNNPLWVAARSPTLPLPCAGGAPAGRGGAAGQGGPEVAGAALLAPQAGRAGAGRGRQR